MATLAANKNMVGRMVSTMGIGFFGSLIGDRDHVVAYFHCAGVASFCFALSCRESVMRKTSSKFRPLVIG